MRSSDPGNASNPRSELSSLVESGLGHKVEDAKFERLLAIREKLQVEQRKLVTLFMQKKIGRDEYLQRLDAILIGVEKDGEKVLGSGDFHRVFGDFRAQNLIDPSIFGSGQLQAR